ncbi:anthrone oxygenase family protein [Bradyrhizobium sp. LHD-71]|uniref:anthrone oxygenase family protein n=1 Tax=Bradyrhizobium sp. LHD-71 TaxID=3072141 RepID=UPI00280CE655|nr:anthrone oxygenase family protein [Bradyrhizobium sp. LHD-71]MDQ8732082.1 DUF1772 domain-containing protein [Bradyrhizobium sp. LHD-71]
MFQVLQIVTILLVAGAMTPALAHALEYPGKLRLERDAYVATQQIYYPGFTVGGGAAEALAIVATLLLVIVTPTGTVGFWLTLAAFVAMLCMHAVYWLMTHPVNDFWLKDVELKGAGRGFFAFDPLGRGRGDMAPDWVALRDQWEVSHMVRAALSVLALALLVVAAVLER